MIDARALLHLPGGENDEHQLNTFDAIAKYLEQDPAHPRNHLHTVLTGSKKGWGSKTMVRAFSDRGRDWDELSEDEQKAELPKREIERLALVAWVEAGAARAHYDADAFPLPPEIKATDLRESFRTVAAPLAPGAVDAEKKPVDKWKEAKSRQLSPDALTQSTHAHLLSFSILCAATVLVFEFISYSGKLRCTLAPIVLVAQVLDIACWWLARLDGSGPYFALAILGTGSVVGLGLMLQIVLSPFNMYGWKGKAVLMLLFLTGAGLFGLTYVKVIKPQLDAEQAFAAQAGN